MNNYYKKYIKYKLKYYLLKDKILKGGYTIDINNNLTCVNTNNNLLCFDAMTTIEQPVSMETNLCTKEKRTADYIDYEYFEKISNDEEFRKLTNTGREGLVAQYKKIDDKLLRDLKNNKYDIYYCNNMKIKSKPIEQKKIYNDIIKIILIEKKKSYRTTIKDNEKSVWTVEDISSKLTKIEYSSLKWEIIDLFFRLAWVDYKYQGQDYYSNIKFMLVEEKTFLKVCQKLSIDYFENYYEYFGEDKFYEKGDHAIYFNKNYRFIQKVNINNKNAKIIIIGDFHSSLHSLYEILKNTRDHFQGDTMKLNENSYIFFLGDVVDRGPYSIELLYFIFILKIINFDKIFIIAGNHEIYGLYKRYGFVDELKNQFKYNSDFLKNEKYDIQKILWYLPECIYLNLNGKRYHLSHGSIVDTLDDKLELFLNDHNQVFMIIYDEKNYINYNWGDFDNSIKDKKPSGRDGYKGPAEEYTGNYYSYGPDLVNDHMKKFKIKMCITGHQDFTPIAFLLKKMNAGKTKIDDNVFYPCSERNNLCYGIGYGKDYKLHSMNKDNFIQDDKKKEKDVFVSTINPENDDLLALVTSTAVISKELEYHCYLILESN